MSPSVHEATVLVAQTSGLRFPANTQTWETYMTFSLQLLQGIVISLATTLYFLLVLVATSPNSSAVTAEAMELNRTTTRRDPKMLSNYSIQATRDLAKKLCFLIIFDNINRQRKFWNPSLGQQDQMMSGTASTLVEFADDTPDNKAFDPKPVLEAQAQNLHAGLMPKMLMDRIDQEHL
ncbi:hypothetical protein FRC11_006857 [Ceratobasidium sp. 423]|nr:hypothetical protein FRC11_006857 [Ceratobasidium sp. 423]